jgi:type IV pilus assembly protein PilM
MEILATLLGSLKMITTTLKRIAVRAGICPEKRKDVVGVDMGSRFMKTVILQAGRPCPTLKDFIIEPVEPRPCDHSQSNLENHLHMIEILHKQMIPPSYTVGISVSGSQVLLKILTLPLFSEKELREHLALELDRYIPLDIQEVVWDVYCHKEPAYLKDGKQEHFLVVAKKEFIEKRMQPFDCQGIQIQFVDVDTFALVNMMTYNYGSEGTWLIIHLGPSGMLSVIVEEGKPLHIRQMSYEVEWYGDLLDRILLAVETPDGNVEVGVSESFLLEQFFKETSEQIMEILKHYSDMSERVVMPNILLSGGYSGVEGFSEKLADSLTLPVTLIDPFRKIAVPSAIKQDARFQKALPLLGVAVGVALRGVVHS